MSTTSATAYAWHARDIAAHLGDPLPDRFIVASIHLADDRRRAEIGSLAGSCSSVCFSGPYLTSFHLVN
jgi:hypothetical protein